ncbi:hypothetical protein [Demequina sp. NBRC 110051]|uniref:hypothetical protein n=1 Tax=Demequina sp. NBRC 110051 TaxID=1570340 RepID=UPI000A013D96|nr:hypothetical protein [Demequina sp. NBRC 110051]
MSTWQAVAVGIIPSIGVALVFWLAMRAVIRADRSERQALARIDEQQAADAVAGSPSGSPEQGSSAASVATPAPAPASDESQ